MKYIEPKTVQPRILKFLQDVHHQVKVKKDDMPRMLYTAMSYRLGHPHIAAAKALRPIHKVGWRWYWIADQKPTKAMAKAVHERQKEVLKGYTHNMNRKRRIQ
jgi:hypothetical protein